MRLPPGITPNVFWLGVVSFFTDASSEMLYPIVPIFLTKTLGASPAIVGVIEGLAEATASLLRIWSGRLSDRLQIRRPLVFAGYGLSALARPLLAIAHGWPLVLTARLIDRFGKGVRSAPRDALLADSVAFEYRGRAFGFHRSMDQLGAVIGPLIGLGLLSYFAGDFRTVFLVAFIPSAVSVAVIALVQEKRQRLASAVPSLRWGHTDPRFRKFLLIVAVFSLGNSSDVFLILRAQQLGLTTTQTVAVFALFNAIVVLAAYPAGVISDRIDRRKVFAAGLLAFTFVYTGFALISSPRMLWFLFPVYGLYAGLTESVSRALVVDLVPPEQRATALGLHAAVLGMAAFPASFIAGLLWTAFGPGAPFLYGAGMAALAALGFVVRRIDSRETGVLVS